MTVLVAATKCLFHTISC